MQLGKLALLNVVRRKDTRHAAIVQHITERGGRVLNIRRTPFAEAWFGKTDGAVFDVTYRDPRGVERQSTCKVSASGILSWLNEAQDPRRFQRLELLTTQERGALEAVTCPFCGTPVYRGAKKCSACRVPFVGT